MYLPQRYEFDLTSFDEGLTLASLHLGLPHRQHFPLQIGSPYAQGKAHFRHLNLEPQLRGVELINHDRHLTMLQLNPSIILDCLYEADHDVFVTNPKTKSVLKDEGIEHSMDECGSFAQRQPLLHATC